MKNWFGVGQVWEIPRPLGMHLVYFFYTQPPQRICYGNWIAGCWEEIRANSNRTGSEKCNFASRGVGPVLRVPPPNWMKFTFSDARGFRSIKRRVVRCVGRCHPWPTLTPGPNKPSTPYHPPQVGGVAMGAPTSNRLPFFAATTLLNAPGSIPDTITAGQCQLFLIYFVKM